MDILPPNPVSAGFNLTLTMVDIVVAQDTGENMGAILVLDAMGVIPGWGAIANLAAVAWDTSQIIAEARCYVAPEPLPLTVNLDAE